MPLCKHLQDFRLLCSVFIVSLLIVNSSSSSLSPPGASYVDPVQDPSTSDPTPMDSLEYGTTPNNQDPQDKPISGGDDPNNNINNGMDQQQQEYGDPYALYPEHPENLAANPLQAEGDLDTAGTFIIPVFGGYGGWGRGYGGGWRGGWGGGWRGRGWGGGWRGGWGGRWGGWRGGWGGRWGGWRG